MKKIDLGQTVQLLANVGVIAGIVFLAIELQQNNKLLQTQSSYNMLQNRMESRNENFENPELALLSLKERTGEPLTALEEWRVIQRNEERILMYEWEFGQFEEGNLNELPVEAYRANMNRKYTLLAYEELKKDGRLSPAFMRWAESELFGK